MKKKSSTVRVEKKLLSLQKRKGQDLLPTKDKYLFFLFSSLQFCLLVTIVMGKWYKLFNLWYNLFNMLYSCLFYPFFSYSCPTVG